MAQYNILRNYDERARHATNVNLLQRYSDHTYQLTSFNNWIKAVLINITSKEMCRRVYEALDQKKGSADNRLLHVLDLGCGRGQDINKWKFARVRYMVAVDLSIYCLKRYESIWHDVGQPYPLYTVAYSFTSLELYDKIEHSYYDVVSAQFCLHYMFQSEQALHHGMVAVLSNLLVGGVFIATIPDSYTMLKKIKYRGVRYSDGSIVYGNTYFSVRFSKTEFSYSFGNYYGFYLQDAIGKKHEDGSIEYTSYWLIDLDILDNVLASHGVCIEKTVNFLEYYREYKEDYKELFTKFRLNFDVGKQMDPELWEIVHLYRVLICRKISNGKRLRDFGLQQRQLAATKEIQRKLDKGNRNHGHNHHHRDRYQHYKSHSHRDGHKKPRME